MGRKLIDLTGQKFGRLTVLKRDPPLRWVCQCDCGTIKSINGAYLRDGRIQSCGCLRKDLAKQRKRGKNKTTGPRNNLVGQRFGKLTAISLVGKLASDSHYAYLCECDCGRTSIVLSHALTSSRTQSCGMCSHKSLGEEKIQRLLEENHIFYEQQKKFPTCRFPDTNRYARFDFWVDNRYLIEFDGMQHFKAGSGWNTEEQVKYTQRHDEYKNQWCLENNIPLLRIPYTMMKNLSFDDIWLPV